MKKTEITPAHEEQLIRWLNHAGCPSQFLQKFKDIYLRYNEEAEAYEGTSEDPNAINSGSLELTIEKLELFMKEINKGHSEKWAALVIDNMPIEYTESEYCGGISFAYRELLKKNKKLAEQELLIHSKSFGEDEIFEKQYIHLIKNDGSMNSLENAKNYAKCYKRLVKEGKSEIYAHYYADWADEYTSFFCENFAFAVEKALSQGLKESDAISIALDFGDVMCNGTIWFDYWRKYSKYLPENVQYLTKYFNDIPDKISIEIMERKYIPRLTEEEVADFILDTIIACKNKEEKFYP